MTIDALLQALSENRQVFENTKLPAFILQEMLIHNLVEVDEVNFPTLDGSRLKVPEHLNDYSWIDDYRELFRAAPRGSRGNKQSCIEKMQWFMENTNFKHTPEQILSATSAYLNDCIKRNYNNRDPETFIHRYPGHGPRGMKLSNSLLLTWVEDVTEVEDSTGYEISI